MAVESSGEIPAAKESQTLSRVLEFSQREQGRRKKGSSVRLSGPLSARPREEDSEREPTVTMTDPSVCDAADLPTKEDFKLPKKWRVIFD